MNTTIEIDNTKKRKLNIEIDQLIMRNPKCGIEEAMKILCAKWNIELLRCCCNSKKISLKKLSEHFNYIPRTTFTKRLNFLIGINLLENDENIISNTEMSIELLNIVYQMDDFLKLYTPKNSSFDERFNYLNKMIGQKWKSRILWLLLNFDRVRFNELGRILEGVSHKILKEALDDMEAMNIVNRIVYDEKIPRVEYSLTQKGKNCAIFIDELSNWSKKYKISSQKVTIIIE